MPAHRLGGARAARALQGVLRDPACRPLALPSLRRIAPRVPSAPPSHACRAPGALAARHAPAVAPGRAPHPCPRESPAPHRALRGPAGRHYRPQHVREAEEAPTGEATMTRHPLERRILRAILADLGHEPDLLLLRNLTGFRKEVNPDGTLRGLTFGLGTGSPDLVGLLR